MPQYLGKDFLHLTGILTGGKKRKALHVLKLLCSAKGTLKHRELFFKLFLALIIYYLTQLGILGNRCKLTREHRAQLRNVNPTPRLMHLLAQNAIKRKPQGRFELKRVENLISAIRA